MKRYPPHYSGLQNKVLPPIRYLENESDTAFCNSIVSSYESVEKEVATNIFPNPETKQLTGEIDESGKHTYDLIDLHGKLSLR